MQKTANTSANNVALRHWSTIFQSIGREWDDEWAVARAETKGWVKGMARASQEVNHSNAMLRNLFKRLLIKYPLAYSNLCKWHCFGKCNYTSNGNHRSCARAMLVWMDDCVHRGHRIFGHLWHSNQFGWSIYFNYNCYYYLPKALIWKWQITIQFMDLLNAWQLQIQTFSFASTDVPTSNEIWRRREKPNEETNKMKIACVNHKLNYEMIVRQWVSFN